MHTHGVSPINHLHPHPPLPQSPTPTPTTIGKGRGEELPYLPLYTSHGLAHSFSN